MMRILSTVIVIVLSLSLCPLMASPASATASGDITVSGNHFHAGGIDITGSFIGICDTTLIPYAIWGFIDGQEMYQGMNQNFPGPEGEDGDINADSITELFHSYFWYMEHFGITLLRTGAYDAWATEIMRDAYLNHYAQYHALLDIMLDEAASRDIYVEIVLAGCAEWPTYDYDSTGLVFNEESGAYANYTDYCQGMFSMIVDKEALFAWDVYNEPDHDYAYYGHWQANGDMAGFHSWASNVSADLCPLTDTIVDMGTGGGVMAHWTEASWDLLTGETGFDIQHIHVYASAEDDYLVEDRLTWAMGAGKPLLIGELGRNDVYPIVRWDWFETMLLATADPKQTAWCTLSLRGTDGYPYYGDVPSPETPTPTIPDEWESEGLSMAQWSTFAVVGFLFAFCLMVFQLGSRRH